MDILPSVDIFKELQDIHDTGFFTAKPSLEDHWQQVNYHNTKKFLTRHKKFAVKLRQRRIQLSKVVNNITQLINRLHQAAIYGTSCQDDVSYDCHLCKSQHSCRGCWLG